MNTLHQYLWQSRHHFKHHLNLMGVDDSLIVYGLISPADRHWLNQTMSSLNYPWHLVINGNEPNITHQEIDHQTWLDLIIQHKKTLAWK